jgi:hypothetical protein
MKLEDHPTVKRIQVKNVTSVAPTKESLDAGWLKQLVLDAGADDVDLSRSAGPRWTISVKISSRRSPTPRH